MLSIGLILLFLYNILTAAKGVFLGNFFQTIHPFLVLTFCFSLVIIFFSIYNKIKDGRTFATFGSFPGSLRTILFLNLSAVIGWSGFYFALKLIEPAIVTSITSGSGPILTAIFYSLIIKNRKITFFEWGIYSLIAFAMVFLVAETFLGFSAIQNVSSRNVLLGVTCAIICGAANVVNAVLSKELNQKGYSARQIIPVRFYLLIVLGAILCPTATWHTLGDMNVLTAAIVVSIFGLAIPILCFQKGIEITNPLVAASVHATIPVFVLAAQLFDDRLVVSQHSVLGAICVTMFSLIAVVSSSLKSRGIPTIKNISEA